MIKTQKQVEIIAQMISKDITELKRSLTGIEIDDSYIHISDDGSAKVYLDQKMADKSILRHSFYLQNGYASDYDKDIITEENYFV